MQSPESPNITVPTTGLVEDHLLFNLFFHKFEPYFSDLQREFENKLPIFFSEHFQLLSAICKDFLRVNRVVYIRRARHCVKPRRIAVVIQTKVATSHY